jgi:hypothetical protein
MPAGGLVTAGVIGLGEAAVGFVDSEKAAKRAKELAATRPKLAPSPYTKDQISLAESELSTGMSGAAKTAYEQDMDKSLSTSLGTSLRMGGTPNNVGSIFANSAEGRARLAIMKDNLRLSQIRNLYEAQGTSEEEREKEFQFNEWAPWADESQANAQAKATGQSEIFSGLSTAAGGAMRFGEGQQATKQQNQYFQFQKYLAGLGKGGNTTGGGGNTNAVAEPTNQSAPDTSFLDNLISSYDF